jgi:Rab GDP dissociation inhibitor
MGLFEKKRCMNFYKYIENVELNDPGTWKKIDVEKQSMKEVYDHYKLESNTIDFLGHAVALHTSDDYLTKPAADTIFKI